MKPNLMNGTTLFIEYMITYTFIILYFMHRLLHTFIMGVMLLGLSANVFFLQMNMTRKFYNQRLQTDPQLHEKGTQKTDSHTTLKQSNWLSFSARGFLNYKGHQEQNLKKEPNTSYRNHRCKNKQSFHKSYSLSVIRRDHK